MKMKLTQATFALLIVTIAMISCSKNAAEDPITTAPPPQTADTLSGKEFIFSDVLWDYWLDDFNELYGRIADRPDLFSNSKRAVDVYVKNVTDTAWVSVQRYDDPNLSTGYRYNIFNRGLIVLPYPDIYPSSGNTQLPGTKFSLKVRFL